MSELAESPKSPELPKYCFARGNRIWYTHKNELGEWKNKKTPYTLLQVEEAARYVKMMLRGMEQRRAEIKRGDSPIATISEYVERWLKDRKSRQIISACDERARLSKFVLPDIGHLLMAELRPVHVRDLVRKLRALDGDDQIAPRTILHVFRTLFSVFESAVVDELVPANPVKVKKGELPKKIDADPEWRPNAMFTVEEVQRLITDPLIPAERRVLYALKAIAGLRHGEAAALCWRHIDYTAQPLARVHIVQALSRTTRKIKRTKTEQSRAVPLHPTLAKILHAWRTEHWKRVYGREPTPDDIIVPARTMKPRHGAEAVIAMHDDMDALKMKKEAGTRRYRGGHDLRSWYKTRLTEDGADSLIARRTTHAAPRDVEGGYERFSWTAICREVGKLQIDTLDGKILPLLTSSLQVEKNAGARWTSIATPTGFEAGSVGVQTRLAKKQAAENITNPPAASRTRGRSRSGNVRSPKSVKTASEMIERALLNGDASRALRLARELRGLEDPAIEGIALDKQPDPTLALHEHGDELPIDDLGI